MQKSIGDANSTSFSAARACDARAITCNHVLCWRPAGNARDIITRSSQCHRHPTREVRDPSDEVLSSHGTSGALSPALRPCCRVALRQRPSVSAHDVLDACMFSRWLHGCGWLSLLF